MQLDTELRQTLWNARHWERVLCERAASLRAREVSADVAEPARALAAALEAVVLDRRHAIEMHLLASKGAGGDSVCLGRARAIALEIGQFDVAARIAALERKRTKDVALALAEGEAWLDAGEPDRAVKPLLAANRARPGDTVAARALAAARREWADVRGEIDRLAAGAAAADDAAAAARDYLHASRIARMLGEAERVRELIELAFARDPRNVAAFALIERELSTAGEWNELLDAYRRRCDAATSPGEVVEALRRGATRMSVTDGAPALAVRMAVRALGYAYDEGVRDVPGHLALVDIICRHYIRARSAEKLLPVIDRGLEADLPDDDAVALAIVGLDVAWSHMGSAATAQRYATRVEPRAPDHPVLAEYKRGGGIVRVSADLAPEDDVLPDALELDDPGWFSAAPAPPAERAPDPAPTPAPSPEPPPSTAPAVEARVEESAPSAAPPVEAPVEESAPSPALPVEAAVEQAAPIELPVEVAVAKPPSPVPPQATPPAPELDDMIELDPDELEELEELEDEDSSASLDESAVVDPGEGLSDATGPFRLASQRSPSPPPAPRMPPAPKPKPGPSAKPAPAEPSRPEPAPAEPSRLEPPPAEPSRPEPPAAAAPAKPAPAEPSRPKPPAAAAPAPAGGTGISLIPGSAKRALEQILSGPSGPPSKGEEKRAERRMAVPADATVSIAANVVFGGGDARAVTRDISRTGAFIVTDAPLPVDTKFELTLALPTGDGMGITEHALRAVVVREEAGVGYGVRFDDPDAEFQQAVSGLCDRQRG